MIITTYAANYDKGRFYLMEVRQMGITFYMKITKGKIFFKESFKYGLMIVALKGKKYLHLKRSPMYSC